VQINAAGAASYRNISKRELKPEPTYLGYADPTATVGLGGRLSFGYNDVAYEPEDNSDGGFPVRAHIEEGHIRPEGDIKECLMLSDALVSDAGGLTLTGTPRAYQDPVNYRDDVGER